ncbi:uncharacterized protein LOC100898004 [Galendromus occidentalis]|uniref:Uncharacterized protein LOC100898004 n=1 Tax=Galendromus occidentalis TaxID=34638 RepID=A0AAJ7L6S6_9ACAR|nr:uncharacterized protein LOC100898004 [Galendromus occidentalis]
MTVARLCRGRNLAVVLGANLLFFGLLLAFQGVRVDVDGSQANAFQPQDSQSAIYKLPKTSASLMRAKYYKLSEEKFCNFMNSEPSRSLMYKKCVCSSGFYGADCGIPRFIWSQLLLNGTKEMTLKRLHEPRRIIEFKFSSVTEPSSVVRNVTVCNNATMVNASLEAFRREVPDLQVYTGPVQANFSCANPKIAAFSCPSLLCCWNRFWMLASELSFTDLVVVDIGGESTAVGSTLPGDLLEFFKFYQGFPEVLMIRRGPSVSVVASFNSIAVECNFDIKCIASCESSKFQVISLDL